MKLITSIKPDASIKTLSAQTNEEQREAHAHAIIDSWRATGQISKEQADKLKKL